MNTFDRKWKLAAAAARRAGALAFLEEVPPGFAARVVARCRDGACEELASLAIWQRFAVRLLGALTLLLVILIKYNALTAPNVALLHPHIENVVADAAFFL